MPKVGVLLVNLGTPNSTRVSDVRKYLRQFLMDGRVLSVPFWKRFFLVNAVIVPFRAPRSAKEYQKLWTKDGSPLLIHGIELKNQIQKTLGKNFIVDIAMRYQHPSIPSVLDSLVQHSLSHIVILPLFPQYASATTGSIFENVMHYLKKRIAVPKIIFINHFYDYPKMVVAFSEIGKRYLDGEEKYDHILFTYHGLPEKQIKQIDLDCLHLSNCCEKIHSKNHLCYRAQCFSTSRAIANALHISKENYIVSFQSRLGKTPWIQPYTEEIIRTLAYKGIKKILVFAPSFVADCLETAIEIGEQYKSSFFKNGGEKLQLVESLNTHPLWVEAVTTMIQDTIRPLKG